MSESRSDSRLREDGNSLHNDRSASIALLMAMLILVGAASIVTYSYNREDGSVAKVATAVNAPSGMPPLTTLPHLQ
jgi:hypothetical protein